MAAWGILAAFAASISRNARSVEGRLNETSNAYTTIHTSPCVHNQHHYHSHESMRTQPAPLPFTRVPQHHDHSHKCLPFTRVHQALPRNTISTMTIRTNAYLSHECIKRHHALSAMHHDHSHECIKRYHASSAKHHDHSHECIKRYHAVHI